ncbi:MAG: sulfite exporter TauE/SafE family protein [Nitrososphaerales archaeon]
MVDLSFLSFLALVPIGVLIGTFSSMLGLGGGILIVPTLVLGLGLPTHIAVGASLVAVFATATSATIEYIRQKRIIFWLGLLTSASTVPGALLGADITKYMSSQLLAVVFSIMLFLISLSMLFTKDRGRSSFESSRPGSARKISVFASMLTLFGAGVMAGMFGVGGGIFVVPIFNIVFGVGIHYAVATSTFTIIFTSLSGLAMHLILGHILFEYAIPLVVGVIVGAQIGSRLAKKMSSLMLRRVFSIVIVGISIYMLITRLFLI